MFLQLLCLFDEMPNDTYQLISLQYLVYCILQPMVYFTIFRFCFTIFMFCFYLFFCINVKVLTMLAAIIAGFLLFWQPATS